MEVGLENRTDEARHLRSCINDLISITALPALWAGQGPREIVKTLLESLIGMLRLDFVYARLDDLAGGAPYEAVRVGGQPMSAVSPNDVGRALEACLTHDTFAPSFTVPDPVGEGEVCAARFSFGLNEGSGMIVAASRRQDFPTETETLLLRVAANQAALALESARLAGLRERAEESLRQRTAQFETLLNEAPLGVYLVDADFRIRQVNPTALAVFGDIPDLIGRDFGEVIHILWPKDYADEVVRLFRHTLETGEPYFVPEWIEERRDRGVTEYYEWQINRIPLPEGRHGVVCYFRDISSQVLARLTIAESEQRYRGIFSQAIAGIAEADGTGRFTNVNDRYCEIVGYSREELMDMRMQDITHPEDLARNLTLFERLITDGTPFEIEKRYVRKDGSIVWVNNSVPALRRVAGRTQSLFAVSIDITERKRSEQRLNAQYEIARALNELGTLSAAAPRIVEAVCRCLDWQVGLLWSVDASAGVLRCVEAWHQPGASVSEFEAASRQRTFSPGVGLPGRVWSRGEPAWIPNATLEDNFPRAPIAAREGLHGAFGLPIRGSGEVLGVIEFFSPDIRQPDQELLLMMATLGSQIGQFIERKRAEEQVASILDSITDSFSVYDREWRVTYFNREAEKLLPRLGLTREQVLGKCIWELLPDLVGSPIYEQYHRAVAEQVPVEFEIFYPPLDGWFEVRAYPSKDGLAVYSQDITERKRAEEALRRAMEFDEAVMTNMGEGLYTVDAEGLVTFMNPAAEKLFGWTLDELRGRKMHDVTHHLHPDGSPFPAEECAGLQVLRQRRTLTDHEDVFIRKDGTFFEVVYSSSPLREGDEITGLVVVFRDITERKQAEAMRLHLSSIVESSDDAIISKSLEGVILSWNKGAERIFGYTAAEAVGKSIYMLIPPDRTDEEANILSQLGRGERIVHYETVRVAKDGRLLNISLTISPIKDKSGKVIAASKIARDITERKYMERERDRLLSSEQAARAEAERRWRESQLLAAATRQFSASLRLQDLLTAICHAAREIAEADGATFVLREGDEVHYVEEDAVAPLWKGQRFPISACISGWAILEHKPAIVEDIYTDARLPVESYRPTFVKSLVMVPVRSHNPLGAIGIYWARNRRADEREVALLEALADAAHIALINTQLYEQTRAAREQAEEASRLKDEFLATVSHELRTPLNAMLGWSRMLRAGKLDGQTTERALETIERNATSQAQLIEDLLDVSRIISGKMRLDVQPVELAPTVQAAVDSVRPAADAKGIRISMVLDPRAGPVSGDPTRLQQIVWNLLSNAIKFTPKDGRVQVRLERVNSHVEIIVSDTGIGISPDFLPHVFDRFRQADGTTTRRHGGLGLGLAIVRHLVELHGGSIEAYSAGEGRGATITIKMPLMIVSEREVFQPNVSERKHPTAWPDVPFECPAALEGLRVLVVDDEPDARQLLAAILGRCKSEVTTAASVAEALEVLERLKPDVLVSDIEMPGEDGYSFIRKVRAKEGLQSGRIPAAALTAHAGVSDRMRALSAGYDIHVPKPVEPAELVAVIASLAGRIGRRPSP